MIRPAAPVFPPFGLRVRQREVDVSQILLVTDISDEHRLARLKEKEMRMGGCEWGEWVRNPFAFIDTFSVYELESREREKLMRA